VDSLYLRVQTLFCCQRGALVTGAQTDAVRADHVAINVPVKCYVYKVFQFVRVQIFTTASMKTTAFLDVASCSAGP
jgi:hypothetical protein